MNESTIKTDGIYTTTKVVPMSFPHLFEPKPFSKNGKTVGDPKYSANFNFAADHPDLKPLKELAARLARATWPDRPFKDEKSGQKLVLFPFANGDVLADKRSAKGRKDGEFTRGCSVVAARSKYAPRLSFLDGKKIVDLDTPALVAMHKDKFYPGVEVYVQLNLVAYEAVGDGLPGINAYLNMVLSTGKGQRLSGGAPGSEVFKGYVGSASAEDPTGGKNIDDEIPF